MSQRTARQREKGGRSRRDNSEAQSNALELAHAPCFFTITIGLHVYIKYYLPAIVLNTASTHNSQQRTRASVKLPFARTHERTIPCRTMPASVLELHGHRHPRTPPQTVHTKKWRALPPPTACNCTSNHGAQKNARKTYCGIKVPGLLRLQQYTL